MELRSTPRANEANSCTFFSLYYIHKHEIFTENMFNSYFVEMTKRMYIEAVLEAIEEAKNETDITVRYMYLFV